MNGRTRMHAPSTPTARLAILLCGAAMAVAWCASRYIVLPRSASAESVVQTGAPLPAATRDELGESWSMDRGHAIARNPFDSHLLTELKRDPAPKQPAPAPKEEPTNEQLQREAASRLELKAISFGPVPVALIGGRAYRVGDTVAGFHVLAIEASQVTIDREGVQIVLRMK